MNDTPTPPTPTRTRAGDRLMGLAALLLLALSGYRAWQVDRSLGAYLDCDRCLVVPVIGQDLWLLFALLSAFLLARWLGTRVLAWMLGLGAAALMLAFVVDVGVQRLLSRRLLWEDLQRYGGEAAANASVLWPFLRTPEGAAFGVAGLALVLAAGLAVARAARAPRRQGRGAWLAATGLVLALAWLPGRTWYLNTLGYENVLAINRGNGMARPYGPATLQRLKDTAPPAPVCEAGLQRQASVIVVVVESLSLRHSRLFSGLPDDLTPGLDALAQRGSWFPDFYANGFSTEGGLIALMTGHAPLSGIRYGTTMLFTQVHGDFHRRLAARGHRTHFFTTGDLQFTGRERWLRAIGVEAMEGDKHPAYDGLPRGAFNAASDAALFDRVLQWYDHERGPAPFMATVLTVGMHPPFVARDGGDGGEAAAVRKADAAIAEFARALDQRGYFRDNLLVVVGDHRMMAPVRRDELQRFGPAAMVRVPAFVVGASGLPPGPVPGEFQQVDLVPSLQYLLDARSCRSPLQGRMLGADPQAAPALVLADPMRYDQVLARVAGREHVLVLDGEDSRWRGAAPDPGFELALEVARLRVGRDRPPPP
ncbi:LTA synthase family protein [Arenimonas sp. MALMAid1274]|uniref:LTA synthase family protein n=1 Tax=Arenimonas sp. MALMAid1274 TaxID=3411630 RepID=UPI003BA078E4